MIIRLGITLQEIKILKRALKEYAVGKGKKTQDSCDDIYRLIENQEKRGGKEND